MSEPMTHAALREAVARVMCDFDAVRYDVLTPQAREWWCVIADATLAAVAEAAGNPSDLRAVADFLATCQGGSAWNRAACDAAALLRALAEAGASR